MLAGAGTGKTRVITHRMVELIRRGIPPEAILSVTFTNKAAREMLERMQALLGRGGKARPLICTFHAYCVRVLRAEIAALGYPPQFVIYDRGDQEAAARKALRDVKVTDATLSPGDLVGQISRWKTAGWRAEQASQAAQDDREFLAAVAYRRYQAHLRAAGALDFDDLLLLTLQLFTEFPDVLARQQARFRHVQIDEYQDTNDLQFRLVAALVQPHRNLCVVGDDDQSIYGWRGAEVRHILQFQQQFPGAKVVRLQDNYRCTQPILEVANRLVRHNRSRHDKTLVAHKPGVPVLFKPYPDEQAEAEGVVREIHYVIQQLQVSPRDIAILFRTNEQPRLFESELRRLRVPYVLIGGQSFFDRREVRDLLAYLKVLACPQDEVSLLRIINVPARGIGEASTEKLLHRAVKSGRSFWDVIPEAVAAKEISPRTAAALADFQRLLHDFRGRCSAPRAVLSEVFQQLIDTIDYAREIRKQYPEPAQQAARCAVIQECVAALREYEARAEQPSLSEFLAETALAGKEDLFADDETEDRPGVRLLTLHSAKGLEFSRVYLVGMEEGLLPHQRALDADSDAAIEEERRLAYVGVTRAREVLTLSWAQTRQKWGKRRETIPSRFLAEMQPERET